MSDTASQSSRATDATTVRRYKNHLKQQNLARHQGSDSIEKLIKQTANSCEDNVRSFMKNELAANIKVDHDTRVTEYKRTLEGLLEDHSRDLVGSV